MAIHWFHQGDETERKDETLSAWPMRGHKQRVFISPRRK
jgi:hypothetical protein